MHVPEISGRKRLYIRQFFSQIFANLFVKIASPMIEVLFFIHVMSETPIETEHFTVNFHGGFYLTLPES